MKTDRTVTSLALTAALAFLVGVVAGNCGRSMASADLPRALDALAFEVARTTMNEALDSQADLSLIWSVVEASAPTVAGRRRWLRQHSPCVSGVLNATAAQERPGLCRWTRNLLPSNEQPTGWPHSRAAWQRMAPRWLALLARSRRHAAGDRLPAACDGQPVTWDGRRWRARAEAQGWVALVCDGTHNLGYVRPSPTP